MTNAFVRNVNRTLGTVAAAARVANAVKIGRTPFKKDLEALGIDPVAFRNIGV